MNKTGLVLVAFLLVLFGCKDPYDIPLRPSDQSSLVVDGFLNSGQGSTTITLSRVLNIKSPVGFKPEMNARVFVEGTDNSSYILTERSNGQYTINQLPLVNTYQYRLRITTTNGKEYRSDYVTVKKTPVIDSISWKKQDEGIRITANAHDQTDNTRYYRWEYEETWEIHSFYTAVYKWVSGITIIRMPSGESTFRCWKDQKSTGILVGSTAQLQSDIVSEGPLIDIPIGSEKIGVRYSILVKQYALTKEAYQFFQLMKKNTESLGTIFDAQPSELSGNMHCLSDSKELVIGFVTASSVEEKRMFITRSEVGGTFSLGCESISILNDPDTIKEWIPGRLPYDAEYGTGGNISRYLVSDHICVDCKSRGGLLLKPSFW